MDSGNYVAPYGNGWIVVVNGQQVGIYGSQSEAEQAYNAAAGGQSSGGTTSPGSNPASGTVDANGVTVYPTVPPTYAFNGVNYGQNYGAAAIAAVQAGAAGSYYPGTTGGSSTSGSTTGGGSGTYQTRSGPMTFQQLQVALQGAGYPGPWDPASMVAAYNNADPSWSGGNGSAASGNFDWDALWNALTGSNREQFDWAKELALKQLAQDNEQFRQQLYSNLAQGLLNGAVSLRGPEDWLSYAQYTTGGQDIFNRLFGSAAAPSFGAPTGFSNPVTLQSILADLGLTGDTTGTTGTTGQYTTINGVRTVQQMRDELKAAGYPNWGTDSDDAIIKAYQDTTKGAVTPAWNQSTASQSTAQAVQQATAPVTGTTTGTSGGNSQADQQWETGEFNRQMNPDWELTDFNRTFERNPAGTSTTPANPNLVPLPHQINPAVWDSLSPTAQAMILASAEQGNTPSGAWDADDFLRQLNNARPKGTAPSRVSFNWGNQQSLF